MFTNIQTTEAEDVKNRIWINITVLGEEMAYRDGNSCVLLRLLESVQTIEH